MKACEMMGLSMSSYYYEPKVSKAEKEEQDADLRGKIEQVRVTHPRAGYRPRKRFVNTTNSNHSHTVYTNLLPEMTVNGVNQVWTSDIT